MDLLVNNYHTYSSLSLEKFLFRYSRISFILDIGLTGSMHKSYIVFTDPSVNTIWSMAYFTYRSLLKNLLLKYFPVIFYMNSGSFTKLHGKFTMFYIISYIS